MKHDTLDVNIINYLTYFLFYQAAATDDDDGKINIITVLLPLYKIADPIQASTYSRGTNRSSK